MTGLAAASDLVRGMIKRTWYETRGFMANITIIIGWYVINVFSYGGITVMTIDATAFDALVIKLGASESRGVVAH
ncbi:MAG: hypothetical protein AMJ53_09520 [Gammaproteobacteria bacterium SG8_11]|nr:MAG: hypothetical protein AMJ53_09520 [Gammaproteobacteria bacterium SG8_11]